MTEYFYEITIGGVEVTDFMIGMLLKDSIESEWSELKLQLNYLANSYLDINADQEVIVKRGKTSADTYIFRGTVVTFSKDSASISIVCYDKLYKYLNKRTGTYTYDKNIDSEAGVLSEIAKDIIETYGGLTASVQDSGTEITIQKFLMNHDFLLERLNVLARILAWQLYYDPINDVVVFEPEGASTLSTILTVGDQIKGNLVWESDKSKLANKLTILGDVQEVETTEEGTIGIGTYNTTDVTLTNTPTSVKVYVDSVLKIGGVVSSSSSYDYYVDVSNKKIVWSDTYTPGSSAAVQIDYSYKVPIVVSGQDDASVTLHGLHEDIEKHKDIVTVDDGIERLRERLVARKNPVVRTSALVYYVDDLIAGKEANIVDDLNNIDTTLIIREVTKQYPSPIDQVIFGVKRLTTPDSMININERLRRLERETSFTQDIVIDIKESTYPVEIYQYTIITNAAGVTQRIVYSTEYIEDFRNDDFKGVGTANWNNTGGTGDKGVLSYE